MGTQTISETGTVTISNEVLAHRPDGWLNIIRDDCMRAIARKGALVNGQTIGPIAVTNQNTLSTEFSITALVHAEPA